MQVPPFWGLWSFLEPRGNPGSHHPQPSGLGLDFITTLLLRVGRVLTLSVAVQHVASGHVGQTTPPPQARALQPVYVCGEPQNQYILPKTHVQDSESGGQVKLRPEECAGALGTLPSVDTHGSRKPICRLQRGLHMTSALPGGDRAKDGEQAPPLEMPALGGASAWGPVMPQNIGHLREMGKAWILVPTGHCLI